MTTRLGLQRLLALFVVGALLFNAPLLRLWSGNVLGLFVAWAALIGALAWLMERGVDGGVESGVDSGVDRGED